QLHVGRRYLQRSHDGFALHGRGFALAYWQADHNVARRAEILNLEVAITQFIHGFANLVYLGGLLVVHLHDSAAGELDRQIKATRRDKEDGQYEGDHTDRVQHQGMAHERDGTAYTEEFHVAFLP